MKKRLAQTMETTQVFERMPTKGPRLAETAGRNFVQFFWNQEKRIFPAERGLPPAEPRAPDKGGAGKQGAGAGGKSAWYSPKEGRLNISTCVLNWEGIMRDLLVH